MRRLPNSFILRCCGCALLFLGPASRAPAESPLAKSLASAPSWMSDERLVYKLLWPSGVSMGEATFQASVTEAEARFELSVEADLPHRRLSYSFSSVATPEGLCSLQFHERAKEGARSWEQSIEFDQQNRQALTTRDGQTSIATVPECARDPLAFFYYFRRELASGSAPRVGAFHLGSNFDLKIETAGRETIPVRGKDQSAEKYVVSYSGPAGAKSFEILFGADPARQPVLIRAPFPLAIFSARLQ